MQFVYLNRISDQKLVLTFSDKLQVYNHLQANIMNNMMIHQMNSTQFPFGQLGNSYQDIKKTLIKKRVFYRNSSEEAKLREKIESLKKITHKNTINLRTIQESGEGFIDLYYPYVPLRLEDCFGWESSGLLVKELHKQFIQLAIFLAKNYIITSFSPERCGVISSQDKTIIKYYLPLSQIIVTNNISMLERSVQLFNLQSMHFLDTLSQNALNTTLQNSSQRSYGKKSRFSPSNQRKLRKQSQPVMLMFNSARKLSSNKPLSKQMRKLSHLSKQLSEFSEMRRKTKESTCISSGSFSTLKGLLSPQSERDLFRSFISESEMIKQKVLKIKQRSSAAIKDFNELRQIMEHHRSVSLLLSKIRS